MRYLFTGDQPETFPTLHADDGTTLVLNPGETADLPDGVAHARLQPQDRKPATPNKKRAADEHANPGAEETE